MKFLKTLSVQYISVSLPSSFSCSFNCSCSRLSCSSRSFGCCSCSLSCRSRSFGCCSCSCSSCSCKCNYQILQYYTYGILKRVTQIQGQFSEVKWPHISKSGWKQKGSVFRSIFQIVEMDYEPVQYMILFSYRATQLILYIYKYIFIRNLIKFINNNYNNCFNNISGKLGGCCILVYYRVVYGLIL